ncbi:MAG TPA: exodeoxyribonuclease VII small subunit [Erysipelothrix sp.]|nr:exodeoxyribonuclease VII small subunit [Erysipelothrix sp.]
MNEFNFDAAMKRLNLIASELEKDDLSLDASIQLFEEGLNLSKQCQEQLAIYENKVKELVSQHSGKQNA